MKAPEGVTPMAEGLNRVMLLGNLGADPDLRVTPGGQAVLKLRLATNESYLDRNNVRQERTEWHRVTVWGRRAEALGKILQKGDSLFIEGRLQTSSYEKNGEKRYSTEVVANNIVLPGRGRGEGAGASAPREGGGGAPRRETRAGGGGGGGSGGGEAAEAPFDDYGQGGGGSSGGAGEDDIPF
jgi:single-strand DNA-binding protein